MSEPELFIRSTVKDGAFALLVPKDTLASEVGVPFTVPSNPCKRDYIYHQLPK